MKNTSLCLVLFLAFGLKPLTVLAAATPVIGTVQAEGVTADDEYVELVNAGDAVAEIGTWSLQYKSANGQTYYKKNFVKGAVIPAGGRYVACGAGYAGSCEMKHSSFSLSSAGGTVFLVNNQKLLASPDDASIINQKTYAETPTAPVDQPSPSPETTVQPLEVSPRAMTPSKPADTVSVTINEFIPAPLSGNEWIELYNGSSYAIDLNGWTLADGTGKSFASLADLLLPNSFRLIELASNKLNNDGDLVILRNSQKQEIDTVAYGNWDNDPENAPIGNEGIAIARIGDGRDTGLSNSDFALTNAPTPGKANQISGAGLGVKSAQAPLAITATTGVQKLKKNLNDSDLQWLADLLGSKSDLLSQLLRADNVVIINNLNYGNETSAKLVAATAVNTKTAPTKNTSVKTVTAKTKPSVSGTVIVPAGPMGSDIAIIRNGETTTEIRLPKDLKTSPVLGDVITASGSWSTAKSLPFPRLLVKTATECKITDHTPPLSPPEVALTSAASYEGQIISVSGPVVSKLKSSLRLTENDASLIVKTNIEVAVGERIKATGIITKEPNDYALIPFGPTAVEVLKPPERQAPNFVTRAVPYGLAVLPAGALFLAVFIGKRLKMKKGGEANA